MAQEAQYQKTTEDMPLVTRILYLVGIIAIVVIGVWGGISAIRLAPNLFATLAAPFTGNDAELVLSVSDAAPSANETLTVSWEHDADTDEGFYSLSYECRDNFSFEVPNAQGSYVALACSTPYSIPLSSNSVRIIPVTQDATVTVPITVAYSDGNGTLARDSVTVTITGPELGAGQEEPDDDDTPTQPQQPTADKADLRVRLTSFGTTDGATYTRKTTAHVGETVSIRFEVANIGSRASGSWYFTANLPTSPADTFTSQQQQSLNPGDRIEYTLSFSRLSPSGGMFRVHADPADLIDETSEVNNVMQYRVSVY